MMWTQHTCVETRGNVGRRRNTTRAAVQPYEPLEASIVRLAEAVAAKEQIPANQLQRVSGLAMLLGQQLGLDSITLAALGFAALVRDVGKICLDERVLCPPTARIEQQQLRQHVIISERMVQPTRLATQAAPMVRYHHERWDGKGYPDGLCGPAIPLGARIIAVAEAFEACSDHSLAGRLTHLAAGAGTAWDPYVIAVLEQFMIDTYPTLPM